MSVGLEQAIETKGHSDLPLYVILGTKAQYIKTAPLLRLMHVRGQTYRLIDTGQHGGLTPALRTELDIKQPDVSLSAGQNISSLFQGVAWLLKLLPLAIFGGSRLRTDLFNGGVGICIIHGDTISTLLGLLIAKRAGMRVAHIEAGLRSFNIFKPFPEEIVRIVCMRLSDYLFAPSNWAAGNLEKMGVKGKVVDTGQNTAVEALYYSLEKNSEPSPIDPPYSVMTVHRMETIFSKKLLSFVVDTAERIAQDMSVVFVVHEATRKQLERFGFLNRIINNRLIISRDLMDHERFVKLLADSELVITDGGSIQEECSYLGVRCLVLRGETERQEGVGENVQLCDFDMAQIDRVLAENRLSPEPERIQNLRPSNKIFQQILEIK
jgi:UDP-N-acetylglucosamine 2-epimerase